MSKEKEREELNKDVEEFLKKGGEIEQVRSLSWKEQLERVKKFRKNANLYGDPKNED